MLSQVDVTAELWKLGPIVGALGLAVLHLYRQLDAKQRRDTKRLEDDCALAKKDHDATKQELKELLKEHAATREKMVAIEAEARGINTGREIMERLSQDVLAAVNQANDDDA